MPKKTAPIKSRLSKELEDSEHRAEVSPNEIEVWSDPEWEPALHALEGWQGRGRNTGKPDPKPLAKLLRSGKPIPEPVAVSLGVLLDPPWGRRGPHLTMSIAKRYSGHADLLTVNATIALNRDIEDALQRSGGKLEAAIQEVADKTGHKRSHLMKVWSTDLKDVILKMAKFNPRPISSPREPDES
jgi:hypothetical protein